MSLLSRPVIRSLCWQLIFFGAIFGLRVLGIHHVDWVGAFCLILTGLGAVSLWLNQDIASYLIKSLKTRGHQQLLVLVYVVIAFIYWLFDPIQENLAQFPNAHFAHMVWPYMLTKTVDITVQQIAFAMFVFDLHRRGVTRLQLQLISAVLLMVSHLATLTSLPFDTALIFIGAAGVAGVVFPVAILHPRGGFAIVYSLHFSYYLVLGVFYNVYFSL